MSAVVTLLPVPTGAKPEVGSIVKLQVFIEGTVGSPGDGWEVVTQSPALWLPSGGVTLSTTSVRSLPAEGNVTKLVLEGMVHQPGPVTVGPFQVRNQVTKNEIDVPYSVISGTNVSAGTKPPQEPPWIQGPVRFGGWNWLTLGALIAVLAAVVAVLGRWGYRRIYAHLNRNLTYTERALNDLANLQKYMRSKQPVPQEEWKKFSFELAGVLRRYSNENFKIDSVDMTDREFLHDLGSHPNAMQFVHLLATILGTITEVRYGRKALDASVIPGLLLDSKKFVESTSLQYREAAKKR
jgi:hypothetical protein